MIKLHLTIACDEYGCNEFDCFALPEPEPGDNDIDQIVGRTWHNMGHGNYICDGCLEKRYREHREYHQDVLDQYYHDRL